jgi:hypothetical protein
MITKNEVVSNAVVSYSCYSCGVFNGDGNDRLSEDERQDRPFEQSHLNDQITILNKKCELLRYQLQHKNTEILTTDPPKNTDLYLNMDILCQSAVRYCSSHRSLLLQFFEEGMYMYTHK